MFHRDRACKDHIAAVERHRDALLHRCGDLEAELLAIQESHQRDLEEMLKRERELMDRLIALANPMAARMMGVGAETRERSTAPASPAPVVGRPNRVSRAGVRPMLDPTTSGFRPLTDLMDEQRRRASEVSEVPPHQEAEEESGKSEAS